jgi:hypothetical protein
MGKKFLNFFSDPAAKAPDKKKPGGTAGPVGRGRPRAQGRARRPSLKDLSTRPQADHVSLQEVDLAPYEESATKYVQPSIDITEFKADDQSYLKSSPSRPASASSNSPNTSARRRNCSNS